MKRKEVRKERPGLNPSQVMKIVSQTWKKMTAEDKEYYEVQSKLDRERYEVE
jgi:structure-specific recognition protein 1